MPRCHGVRIAEAKRSRHQSREQRALRICLSRLTSFGGTRACVFTLSTTTPLDGTMQTASAAVKLVSKGTAQKPTPKPSSLSPRRLNVHGLDRETERPNVCPLLRETDFSPSEAQNG